ncbi:hypothetical protein CDN98_12425 [Roseateles terrae]|nr:hypothetical protein CDN98_12425 [Roseateles terrae]
MSMMSRIADGGLTVVGDKRWPDAKLTASTVPAWGAGRADEREYGEGRVDARVVAMFIYRSDGGAGRTAGQALPLRAGVERTIQAY